ncbi:MAG: hypothetical protein IT428_26235 [Planctomycetaceae bacterium]|nr:hypothetical protein [Planctomycetaceae bacterium]
MTDATKKKRGTWWRENVDDGLAAFGVFFVFIGLVGWSWPAAFVWLGLVCLAVAWAVRR